MSIHQLAAPKCKFQQHCQLHQSLRDGGCCQFAGRMNVVKTARKEFIYHEDDVIHGVFILRTGLVALERVSEKGNRVIVRLVQPGELFPFIDLTSAQSHTSAARALDDVTACLISRERLVAAARQSPRFGLAMIGLGSALMRRSEDSMLRICGSEFPDLVLAQLHSLGMQLGRRNADGDLVFTLPMTWQDFAALVGITPESLSRLLRRLAKAGQLRFRGHEIAIAAAEGGPGGWTSDVVARRSCYRTADC